MPGRRALRSASINHQNAPPVKLSTIGGRAFPVAASQNWNFTARKGINTAVVPAPTKNFPI